MLSFTLVLNTQERPHFVHLLTIHSNHKFIPRTVRHFLIIPSELQPVHPSSCEPVDTIAKNTTRGPT